MLRKPGASAGVAMVAELIVAFCGSVCFRNLAFAQMAAGSITGIKGSAQLIRGVQTLTIAVGTAVEVGDKIITATKAEATLRLRDGSTLTLGESSTMTIDHIVGAAAGAPSVIGLLSGHLRSAVATALRGTIGSFEIHTPNAIAGVRGTKFDTAFIEGTPCPGFPKCLRYTDVGVFEGIVEVFNPTNPSAAPVTVKAGYETTVPCEEPPSSPGPLGIEEMGGPGYH
ncbi:MAG TPA: FecR family protein [Candidatus Binataceae bacterium]|jgi:ferric-dicitrate binding protein FerR (iron transport regulator)